MKRFSIACQHHLIWALTIFVLYFLVACGPAVTSQPTAALTPSAESPIPAQAVVTNTTATLQIDLTTLKSYTNPDNRFSISYPGNWETFNQPQGVVFIDANDQAGYSVMFTDVGQEYNADELNQYLLTFIAQNFGDEESNFKAISREQQPDGTVIAQFYSRDPNLGPSINEVRVLQKDGIIYVLNASAKESQWPTAELQLQALLDTFTPLETSSNLQGQTLDPQWVLIGPTSQEFGFLYASNWTILEQDENIVSVAFPDENMTFTVNNYPLSDADNTPNAAEIAALAHLEEISAQYEDVQNLPPTEFKLDTVTGSTIDFIYTAEDGTNMAGSIITAAANNNIYKVVFTAPTDFYDAALQWFNPMYKSVKFLDPNDLPPAEQEDSE